MRSAILSMKYYKSNQSIGRKNKEIIKSKFMEKLNIEESEADELYNISMETILKDFFKIK